MYDVQRGIEASVGPPLRNAWNHRGAARIIFICIKTPHSPNTTSLALKSTYHLNYLSISNTDRKSSNLPVMSKPFDPETAENLDDVSQLLPLHDFMSLTIIPSTDGEAVRCQRFV